MPLSSVEDTAGKRLSQELELMSEDIVTGQQQEVRGDLQSFQLLGLTVRFSCGIWPS